MAMATQFPYRAILGDTGGPIALLANEDVFSPDLLIPDHGTVRLRIKVSEEAAATLHILPVNGLLMDSGLLNQEGNGDLKADAWYEFHASVRAGEWINLSFDTAVSASCLVTFHPS